MLEQAPAALHDAILAEAKGGDTSAIVCHRAENELDHVTEKRFGFV
jgi:hypothetical protein